jgi:polyhydroxyalkanoate synthesis regulator phasin
MPEAPDWRQLLETGREFTALTRAEAQQRAQELVREGQLAQERVQSFVDDLVRTSRKRADEFVEAVRREVQRQLRAMGLAPGRARAKKSGAKKKPAKKAKKAKKPAAKKAKNKSPAKKKSAKTKAAKKKTAKAGTKKPSGSG